MQTLKDILSNYGYINQAQLTEINEYFPHMRVVIKWSGLPRDRVPVHHSETHQTYRIKKYRLLQRSISIGQRLRESSHRPSYAN